MTSGPGFRTVRAGELQALLPILPIPSSKAFDPFLSVQNVQAKHLRNVKCKPPFVFARLHLFLTPRKLEPLTVLPLLSPCQLNQWMLRLLNEHYSLP